MEPKNASKKPPKPVYVGVILDHPDDLSSWWEQQFGELLPKKFCHHLTIKFGPTLQELQELPIGEKFLMEVVGYAQDENIQAVVVTKGSLRVENKIPHITVATDGVTPPVKSNELLEKGYVKVDGPVLFGRVGFLAEGKEHFSLDIFNLS